MREIKFRGLAANGEFAFGCLLKDRPNSTNYYETFSQRISWFCDNGGDYNVPVINGTVGQYTGLKDCEGTEIYEGDLIQMSHRHTGAYEVVWFQSDFGCGWKKRRKDSTTDIGAECCVMKVIGNIHQNPELMK